MDFYTQADNKTVLDKRERCPVETIDQDRAKRLRDFAGYQKWASRRSLVAWEEPFAIQRRMLGDEHTKIDLYLDWYIKWFKPGRKPEIRNGKEFRHYFNWLEQLYNKHNPPNIDISEDARSIARTLDVTQPRTLIAIQTSLDYYREFRDKLIGIWNKYREIRQEGQRTNWIAVVLRVALFRNDLTEPTHFVLEWFREIVEWFREKQIDWNGDLSKFALSSANEKFEERVRSSLDEFADIILKEIESKSRRKKSR